MSQTKLRKRTLCMTKMFAKFIFIIQTAKNGVTDAFDIKNISHGSLENLLAGTVKYLKFMQEIIEK